MDKSQWKDIIWPVWKKPYQGLFWKNVLVSLPYTLISGLLLFPFIYAPIMPVGEEILLNFRYTGNLSRFPETTFMDAVFLDCVFMTIIYLFLVIPGYRGFFDCKTPDNNKIAKKIWDEICETSLFWNPTDQAVEKGWCSREEQMARKDAMDNILRAQLPIRIIHCNVPLSRVPNLQELIQEALTQYEAQKQAQAQVIPQTQVQVIPQTQAQVIPQTQVQTPPPVSSDQLR